jgi:hypothetical protein
MVLQHFKIAAVRKLTERQNKILQKIEMLNLSRITKRHCLQEVISHSAGLLLEQEYKKFLILCALHPGKNIPMGGQVDDYWHSHILDTVHYMTTCHEVFGYFIHHTPSENLNSDVPSRSIEVTHQLLENLFIEFDLDKWGKADGSASCANCSGCEQGIWNAAYLQSFSLTQCLSH